MSNQYLYNGKELQDELGLQWYDYGARMYDAAVGRFFTQDRFAEKYLDFSPYQYGANSPINFVDINGDSIDISGLLQNKDIADAFKAFFDTNLGKKYIGLFAAEGQEVLGYTFERDGAFHKSGVDLSFGTQDGFKDGRNGETGEVSGRLKIEVTIK